MYEKDLDDNIINTFIESNVNMNLDHVVIEDNMLFSCHNYITRIILSHLFLHFKEEKYKRILYNLLSILDTNIHFLCYSYDIKGIFDCMYVYIDKIEDSSFNLNEKRLFKDKLHKAYNIFLTAIKPYLVIPFDEGLIIKSNMRMLDNLVDNNKIKTISIIFNNTDYDTKEFIKYMDDKYRSKNKVIIQKLPPKINIIGAFKHIMGAVNQRLAASSDNIALWLTDNPELIVGLAGLSVEKLMYKINTIMTPLSGKFMLSTYLTNSQTLEDLTDRLKQIGIKLISINYKQDEE